MDDLSERAATLPGWPAGPDLVHLVYRGLTADTWITMCPAGGEGLPDGEHRKAVLALERIDCAACQSAAPDIVEQINAATARVVRERHATSLEIAGFLRWLREEKHMVIADYAGGVTLKAYPSTYDDGLIQEWIANR